MFIIQCIAVPCFWLNREAVQSRLELTFEKLIFHLTSGKVFFVIRNLRGKGFSNSKLSQTIQNVFE